jgi:hypothetical protein
MKAEAILYALLGASSSLAALVGTRIYLDTRPEEDGLPAVVYALIHEKQDDARIGEPEAVTARLQVNGFAAIAEDAVAVREAVRLACHNRSGVIAGVTVIACLEASAGPDSYDHLVNIYTKPMDFILHYLRSEP